MGVRPVVGVGDTEGVVDARVGGHIRGVRSILKSVRVPMAAGNGQGRRGN